jgi:hypothetical protein
MKCGKCEAECCNLEEISHKTLDCCLCRKEATPCRVCKPELLVKQEDEWENKGSHSDAFKMAAIVTTEDEWETTASHSEAFKGAALVAEEEEWETTGSHSEAFRKVAIAPEDGNTKP